MKRRSFIRVFKKFWIIHNSKPAIDSVQNINWKGTRWRAYPLPRNAWSTRTYRAHYIFEISGHISFWSDISMVKNHFRIVKIPRIQIRIRTFTNIKSIWCAQTPNLSTKWWSSGQSDEKWLFFRLKLILELWPWVDIWPQIELVSQFSDAICKSCSNLSQSNENWLFFKYNLMILEVWSWVDLWPQNSWFTNSLTWKINPFQISSQSDENWQF